MVITNKKKKRKKCFQERIGLNNFPKNAHTIVTREWDTNNSEEFIICKGNLTGQVFNSSTRQLKKMSEVYYQIIVLKDKYGNVLAKRKHMDEELRRVPTKSKKY